MYLDISTADMLLALVVFFGIFVGPGLLGLVIAFTAGVMLRRSGKGWTVFRIGLLYIVCGHVAFVLGYKFLMPDQPYHVREEIILWSVCTGAVYVAIIATAVCFWRWPARRPWR